MAKRPYIVGAHGFNVVYDDKTVGLRFYEVGQDIGLAENFDLVIALTPMEAMRMAQSLMDSVKAISSS